MYVIIYLDNSPETYTHLAGVYHGDKHREGKKEHIRNGKYSQPFFLSLRLRLRLIQIPI